MNQLEQVTAIHSFLRVIFTEGDLIEVRGLKSDYDGTLSVLTDDLHLAARTASSMEKRGADVYYTLNPISRESGLMKRVTRNTPSRHVGYGATTGDKDIASRSLYLIDIDPKRRTGTAATEEQRSAAMATAQEVRTFLEGRGWPDPIMLDSGNGVHLLYRGNRCSADGTHLGFALKQLNSKFGAICTIDQVVANPSRIARMPHCLNRKAGRRASIISLPAAFTELPPWLVLRLAEEDPTYKAPSRTRPSPSTSPQGTLLIDEDDVLDLIDEFPDQLVLAGDPMYKDDATYFALASCPFKGAPHTGQAVGMGKTTIILRSDSIGFKCFSDDCGGHSFSSLLKLLHARTSRWPSMQIWGDDTAEFEARWGGVEDVSHRTRAEGDTKAGIILTAEEFARLVGGTIATEVGQ